MLKGILEGLIKARNTLMFTRINNTVNHNYNVARGGTMIHITVLDKESAEALGKSIRGESTKEPELIQSEQELQN